MRSAVDGVGKQPSRAGPAPRRPRRRAGPGAAFPRPTAVTGALQAHARPIVVGCQSAGPASAASRATLRAVTQDRAACTASTTGGSRCATRQRTRPVRTTTSQHTRTGRTCSTQRTSGSTPTVAVPTGTGPRRTLPVAGHGVPSTPPRSAPAPCTAGEATCSGCQHRCPSRPQGCPRGTRRPSAGRRGRRLSWLPDWRGESCGRASGASRFVELLDPGLRAEALVGGGSRSRGRSPAVRRQDWRLLPRPQRGGRLPGEP